MMTLEVYLGPHGPSVHVGGRQGQSTVFAGRTTASFFAPRCGIAVRYLLHLLHLQRANPRGRRLSERRELARARLLSALVCGSSC